MPRRPPAEGTGDGGHETDGVDDNKRARASSKGKEDAAGPALSKKRAAPADASTSKAAKKNRTSAPACQVRSDRNTASAKVACADCQHTARFTNQMW